MNMKRLKGIIPFMVLFVFIAAHGLAKDSGNLIILNKTDNNAMIVDLETGKTITTLPTGEGPHEVAVTSDGKTAAVANYGHKTPSGNSLTIIDMTTHKIVETVSLGEYERPHGVVFLSGSRKLLVTAERQKKLLLVDLDKKGTDKIIKTFPTEQEISHMVALTPDGKTAVVSSIVSGSATVIKLDSNEPVKVIPTGKGAEGLDISPDGKYLWVGNRADDNISVIDIASEKVIKTIPCAKFPIRVKFTPDGKEVLVSAANSGELVFFDAKSYKETHRIPFNVSEAKDSENRMFSNFKGSPVPVGILVHPKGKTAFVATTNADHVAVVDIKGKKLVKWFKTGKQPDGLGFTYQDKK
jgi:YVTN family beta-propeller protein